MDWIKLENLIDKYYAGTTSVSEENEMHELLQREDLPEKFGAEAAMFGYYKREMAIAPEKPLDIIRPDMKRSTQWTPFRLWTIAASIALLVTSGVLLFSNNESKSQPVVKTNSSMESAFQSTAGAFMVVSDMIQESKTEVQKLDKIEKTREKAVKSLSAANSND
jgi:hypothetical protein